MFRQVRKRETWAVVRENLKKFNVDPMHDGALWEEVLYEETNYLKSDAISMITKALKVSPAEVANITVLKKGMTNRSFLFTCRDKKFIIRIPGEGTDQLINRREE